MALEYVIEGLFSIKSDVYSFEILMLEIVSGKKNSAFFHPECAQNLSSYVRISLSYVSCAQIKFTLVIVV